MNDRLCQLAYISRRSSKNVDMEAVLTAARERNRRLGITGALWCLDSYFIQVLEGPRTDVQRVYHSICDDRRHSLPTPIYLNDIADRDFPDWTMHYLGDANDIAFLLGQCDLDPVRLEATISAEDLKKTLRQVSSENETL